MCNGHASWVLQQKRPPSPEASDLASSRLARCQMPPPGWANAKPKKQRRYIAAMLPEDDQVELIAQVAGAGPGVLVGIGDDAAVLAGGVLVSSDMLVDGVHFDRSRLSPRQIGHRAAGANLSDLAAMGGAPTCLIASFGIPVGFHDVQELAAGLADHGVPAGGRRSRPVARAGRVGDGRRSRRQPGAARRRHTRRRPDRQRPAGRAGGVRLHAAGHAAAGGGRAAGEDGARHDRHLRRHRHRRAAAGPRVRDRRADRTRAAAARARGERRAGGRRRRGLRAAGRRAAARAAARMGNGGRAG